MEKFIEKYKDSNIYMVSALDSLGVPYTLDNINSKSFVDLVADEFKSNNINIEYVNLCSLARNKTWELIKILKHNYRKGEYYNLNKKHADYVIEHGDRFDHPYNYFFTNNYYDNVSNPNLKITSTLRTSTNPIFLYSCGGMNFDYYSKMPTCDIKKILPKMVFHLNENINKTMNDICECLNYINCLNIKMEIYVLGVYPMLENEKIRAIATPLYRIYNDKLKAICNNFINVHYVDIFDTQNHIALYDNHPDFEGQKYISKQIIKTMNATKK